MQSLRALNSLHIGLWTLMLLVLVAISSTTQAAMPNKFIVINEKKSFFEAWRTCQFLNLQLASVNNVQENEQLRELLKAPEYSGTTFWVAGTDVGLEGRWIWITSNSPVVFFTNWGQINPDNSNDQDCMTVGTYDHDRTLWDDRNCEESHRLVCERVKKPAVEGSHD